MSKNTFYLLLVAGLVGAVLYLNRKPTAQNSGPPVSFADRLKGWLG